MKIAFSTLACPDWTWREIIENGCRYGYDGVEVRLIERETDLFAAPEFQRSQLARRKTELADAGFRICGLGSSVRFDHGDEAQLARELQTGRAYLDLASELGAEFVRVFGDTLPPKSDAAARRRIFGDIVDGLNTLGEYAETLDLKVIMETHGDFSDSRIAGEALAAVESPAVGVLWDTHHPWRFCDEPLGDTHNRLSRWIAHTHWKDSVSVSRFGSAPPSSDEAAGQAHALMSGHQHADYVLFGGGEFPAEECLSRLAQSGYDGWFSYEWEKMWHPEIEPPEVALPLFPAKLRRLAEIVAA